MSSSTFDKNEEKEKSIRPAYTLSEGGFPDVIIVSEASKKAFAAANEIDWNTKPALGQGFIEVSFKIFNKDENRYEIHSESIPCFNKDDGKPREDKYGNPYVIFDPLEHKVGDKYTQEQLNSINFAIEAPEQLGKNTGIVHRHAQMLLRRLGRLPKEIPSTDIYGSGYFRGGMDRDGTTYYLISECRGNSGNINTNSINWDREAIVANNYSAPSEKPPEKLNPKDQMYSFYIKRQLPPGIIEQLRDAKLKQLGTDYKDSQNKVMRPLRDHPVYDWWQKYGNNPKVKNSRLITTLFARIRYGVGGGDKTLVDDILRYIKANNDTLNINPNSEDSVLNQLLENDNTVLMYACRQNNDDAYRIVNQLIKAKAFIEITNRKGETALDIAIENNSKIGCLLISNVDKELAEYMLPFAIEKNKPDVVLAILEKEINLKTKHNANLIFKAALLGQMDIVNLLKEHGAEPDRTALQECFFTGIIHLAKNHDYHNIAMIIKEYGDMKLNNQDKNGNTPEEAIFASIIENINKNNLHKLEELQQLLPDLFEKLIRKKSAETELYSIAIEKAISQGKPTMLDFLLKKQSLEHKTEKAQLMRDCELIHIYSLIKEGKYSEAKDIMTNYNFDLDVVNDEKPSIKSALFKSFEDNIINNDIPGLNNFKIVFGDNLYHEFFNEKIDASNELIETLITKFPEDIISHLKTTEYKTALDSTNSNGETLLMMAAGRSNIALMNILLEKGALRDVKDKNGKTFYDHLIASFMGMSLFFTTKNLENLNKLKEEYPEILFINPETGESLINVALIKLITETIMWTVGTANLMKIKETFPNHFNLVINKKNLLGSTPLFVAIANNNLEALKYILAEKASIEIINEAGQTPLQLAIANENHEAIILLVKNNAKLEGDLTNAENNILNKLLHDACGQKNFDKNRFVEQLIEAKASIMAKNIDGDSALSIAIKNNNSNLIDILLKYEDSSTFIKENPLLILNALEDKPDSNMIDLLINKKALIAQNSDGMTPLHLAVQQGNIDILERLIDRKADVNAQNKDGMTPLHLAVQQDSADILDRLINRKADVNAQNKDGATPIIIAIENNKRDMFVYLKDQANANMNMPNNAGITPYLLAVRRNFISIHDLVKKKQYEKLEELIKLSPDIIYIKDKNGKTCLYNAIKSGNLNVVELFVNNINESVKYEVLAGGTKGINIIDFAIKQANRKNTPDSIEIATFLIKQYANIREIHPYEAAKLYSEKFSKLFINDYFHAAIKKGDEDLIETLIEDEADINAVINGKTPLQLALAEQKDNSELVKLLTENKAEVKVIKTQPLFQPSKEESSTLDLDEKKEKNSAYLQQASPKNAEQQLTSFSLFKTPTKPETTNTQKLSDSQYKQHLEEIKQQLSIILNSDDKTKPLIETIDKILFSDSRTKLEKFKEIEMLLIHVNKSSKEFAHNTLRKIHPLLEASIIITQFQKGEKNLSDVQNKLNSIYRLPNSDTDKFIHQLKKSLENDFQITASSSVGTSVTSPIYKHNG